MLRDNAGLAFQDQRSALRVPVQCKVRIRVPDLLGLSFYGDCTDLSVQGLSVRSNYVPREEELLEVFVMPPRGQGAPMAVLARVKRCHEIEPALVYEMGMEIEQVLR